MLVVVLALFLVTVGIGCADARLAVHVENGQLVDGRGQPVRLLGVNRSGAEYACVHGLASIAGPTDRRAIAAMVAWRINAVRIPLNEACWLGINRAPARYSGAPYRHALRAYVTRLHAAGLYVVLDLHWNAPGTAQAVGQHEMADLDHSPAFWASVALTFRRDPAIVFDLYNEPNGISWQCWRDGCPLREGWSTAGMQALVDAVRSTGANQALIATGLEWGSDLSSWLQYRPHDPAQQLAAGMHVFDFSPCDRLDCWTTQRQAVLGRAPIVTTEIGQRDCSSSFVDRYMTWADRASVSYLGWAWNPAGCGAPALVQTWDGRPTASGNGFRSHLQKIR